MYLTSFGDDSTEPPALPCCRDDALVDKGAKASKPCLSPVEMRTLTAVGDLLPARTASTATRTIFHQPSRWFCPTEEMNSRTSIQYATMYRSFWVIFLLPCTFFKMSSRTSIPYATTYSSLRKMKVLEMKSRQILVFDPGGCTGRLRACPFLGGWRALVCGEVFAWTLGWYPRLESVKYREDWNVIFKRGQGIRYIVRIAVDSCLPEARLIRGSRQSQMARGYGSCGDKRMSGNAMERGA